MREAMAAAVVALSKPLQLVACIKCPSTTLVCFRQLRLLRYHKLRYLTLQNVSVTTTITTSTGSGGLGLSLGLSSRYSSSGANDYKQRRQMSSHENSKDEEMTLMLKHKPKEFQVKTTYGHIACLEWGSPDAPHKIFCLHGWLDNVGSFTRLIPHILEHNSNLHIIAIDMPGVGKSSHLPIGASYTTFLTIIEMRRVMKAKKWDKGVTLLGHSLGSHYSFLYCCIYPNQIESFISIDLSQPLANQAHNWNVTIANSIEEYFKSEHGEQDATTSFQVPIYSEKDAINRLLEAHSINSMSVSLTTESAYELLKYGATKESWGYTFNRDIRWRHLSAEFRPTDELMLQYLEGPFRPNLFIIRARSSPYQRPDETRLKYYELYKKNCPIFQDVLLDGTHHLHMNTPNLVAQEINRFLDELKMAQQPNASLNKSNL